MQGCPSTLILGICIEVTSQMQLDRFNVSRSGSLPK